MTKIADQKVEDIQADSFEHFLADSFRAGITQRELRLSFEELEYLRTAFPSASIVELEPREQTEAKCWYLVKL